MLKSIFPAIVLFIFSTGLFSQDIVLEKDVTDQYKEGNGPNMRNFRHFYIGFGGIIDFDESPGTAINAYRSGQITFGYRYKLKLLSFYALGLDLNFKSDQYFMEGDDANPYDPNNPLALYTGEKRQTFTDNGIGLEIYQRINIGKRGNTLGKYLDAGFRAQWNVTDVEELVINYNDPTYTGRQRIFNRRLQYVEDYSYGLSARIGFDHFIIYGYYRLSDIFKDSFNIPELPRLSVGLQYAFY